MDIESLLYSLLIGGTIVWSVVKKFNKEEKERQVKKGNSRRITVEPDVTEEEARPRPRMAKAAPQPAPNNEYFSYETMSERDFEQAFAENASAEETPTVAQRSEHPHPNLSLDEEEVFKGVVWSEILKRKY